eukprot:894996-Pyramimonas_sp.AAC.1
MLSHARRKVNIEPRKPLRWSACHIHWRMRLGKAAAMSMLVKTSCSASAFGKIDSRRASASASTVGTERKGSDFLAGFLLGDVELVGGDAEYDVPGNQCGTP